MGVSVKKQPHPQTNVRRGSKLSSPKKSIYATVQVGDIFGSLCFVRWLLRRRSFLKAPFSFFFCGTRESGSACIFVGLRIK